MTKKPEYVHYEALYTDYPDVVDLETVRKMLGGISFKIAYRLVRENRIKHIFYQEKVYLIPKVWVIDYVVSDHYKELKLTLKNQV